jgi:hypothetical protein
MELNGIDEFVELDYEQGRYIACTIEGCEYSLGCMIKELREMMDRQ